ncbi:MAG TPA: hypothetical protein VMX55_05120 [candidate division Zixibacteria bacterium]|nr:hypothetical protein [candidate division Zixibacteria bacterium]
MSKKAICLLSDGLDSPVATFLLEKTGIEVIGINFNNNPFVGLREKSNHNNSPKDESSERNSKQIKNIAQTLLDTFKKQEKFTLYRMPHGEDLRQIIEQSKDNKITCVLCKRLMLRKAKFVATKLKADIIATGDILGEQASQTIDNLQVIQEVLKDIQLIRPNLGLNKEEVIEIARKIGTYQFSELAAKFTCLAVPNKPATVVSLDRVEKAEQKLEIEDMVKSSWNQVEKFTFRK